MKLKKIIKPLFRIQKKLAKKTKTFSEKFLAPALQIQAVPAIGYLISFMVGLVYMLWNNHSFYSASEPDYNFSSQGFSGALADNLQNLSSPSGSAIENLYPTLIGFLLSSVCFLLSFYFAKKEFLHPPESQIAHDSSKESIQSWDNQKSKTDQHEASRNHKGEVFKPIKVNLNKAAWIVFLGWSIAVLISSIVYLIAGFPSGGKLSFVSWSISGELVEKLAQGVPYTSQALSAENLFQQNNLSILGRLMQNFELFLSLRPTFNLNWSVFWDSFSDSIFESVSGFTTTGSSILPNIEIFPKSVLFWRSFSQWLGGMGIAYIAATFIKKFLVSRNEVINSEVESPTVLEYNTEMEARKSGMKFFLAYFSMTVICIVCLFVSSLLFRSQKIGFAGSLFESLIHGMGAVASGGFSNYNSSVGNSKYFNSDTNFLMSGLQNPISEWVMAIFMLFSGINFGIWYILLFDRKKITKVWQSGELWVYLSIVLFLTTGIWAGMIDNHEFLQANPQYQNPINSLRYAFFNVSTIISTAGYSNTDFTRWPSICLGLLFACFLLGGCVGSTSGGLKISRFMIMYRFAEMEIKNIIFGNHRFSFVQDGIKYNYKKASIVVLNIAIYFLMFLVGGVLIMATSPVVKLIDGSIDQVDFVSAMTASLSTLGGIGPAASVGVVDAGPNGNYGAYSSAAKWIMSFLMYFGRVGVISIFMMFMTKKGESEVDENLPESQLV